MFKKTVTQTEDCRGGGHHSSTHDRRGFQQVTGRSAFDQSTGTHYLLETAPSLKKRPNGVEPVYSGSIKLHTRPLHMSAYLRCRTRPFACQRQRV